MNLEFTNDELAMISFALGIMTGNMDPEYREKNLPMVRSIMKKIETQRETSRA